MIGIIGADPLHIECVDDGMDVVGGRMKSGEMFIREVLRCAKAMSQAVAVLKPLLSVEDATN